MTTSTKTLRVRIKDKHAKVLSQWAYEVNQVWNAANEISAEYSWVPIPGVGYMNCGTSEYDCAFTVVRNPKDELKTGTFHGMCSQLGIKPNEL
jgi:hypothetical protein